MFEALANLMTYAPTAPEAPYTMSGVGVSVGRHGSGRPRLRYSPTAAVLAAKGIVAA